MTQKIEMSCSWFAFSHISQNGECMITLNIWVNFYHVPVDKNHVRTLRNDGNRRWASKHKWRVRCKLYCVWHTSLGSVWYEQMFNFSHWGGGSWCNGIICHESKISHLSWLWQLVSVCEVCLSSQSFCLQWKLKTTCQTLNIPCLYLLFVSYWFSVIGG